MTRWQVFKSVYRYDPVGVVLACLAGVVVAAIAVLHGYEWWVTDSLGDLSASIAAVATLFWAWFFATSRR